MIVINKAGAKRVDMKQATRELKKIAEQYGRGSPEYKKAVEEQTQKLLASMGAK